MKVYLVVGEVDDYQSLLATDEMLTKGGLFAFDGSSKAGDWPDALEAELDNENGLVPDIYDMNAGNLVLTGNSLEILKPELDSFCELLPVYWNEGKGQVVNVIGTVDCLDHEKTKWHVHEKSGKRLFIEHFAFIKERLPHQPVFKIAEAIFDLLIVDQEDGSENLKTIVEKNRFTGLSFELLWECD